MSSEKLKKLCDAAPKSAVALYIAGRGTSSIYDSSLIRYEKKLLSEIIINSQTNNEAIREIKFDVPIKPTKILKSLKIENSLDFCFKTAVNRKIWHDERKLRISGSRIYDIYTYTQNSKANWSLKAQKFFWPQAMCNKYVKHGLMFEDDARDRYSELFNADVVQCGFVVHPDYQWLGYTPDGVIFRNGKPEKLLEIKCIYNGKDSKISDCLQEITFLDKETSF